MQFCSPRVGHPELVRQTILPRPLQLETCPEDTYNVKLADSKLSEIKHQRPPVLPEARRASTPSTRRCRKRWIPRGCPHKIVFNEHTEMIVLYFFRKNTSWSLKIFICLVVISVSTSQMKFRNSAISRFIGLETLVLHKSSHLYTTDLASVSFGHAKLWSRLDRQNLK